MSIFAKASSNAMISAEIKPTVPYFGIISGYLFIFRSTADKQMGISVENEF